MNWAKPKKPCLPCLQYPIRSCDWDGAGTGACHYGCSYLSNGYLVYWAHISQTRIHKKDRKIERKRVIKMSTKLNISPERFAQGLTMQKYFSGIETNKDVIAESYANFKLRPEDADFFRDLGLDLNVLVLLEDWCGDATRYVPALARVVEAVPNWEARVFYRDQNPDLSEVWLKDGNMRAIPVIVFFDKQMIELAHRIAKPAAVYA